MKKIKIWFKDQDECKEIEALFVYQEGALICFREVNHTSKYPMIHVWRITEEALPSQAGD